MKQEVDNISDYLASLPSYSISELKEKLLSEFNIKYDTRNKNSLIRKLSYKIQEKEYGGLSERTKILLREEFKPSKPEDTSKKLKIKPGTELSRVYRGVEFRVKVRKDGFEFNGFMYKSLTMVAKVITGQKTSGPLFFGLK